MKAIIVLLLITGSLTAQTITEPNILETRKWREQSLNVKIIRDQWGIAHVYGKTDADAVFGMLYAQCEDDFNRVERNYLTATGRLAETLGEEYIYHDLRTRLFQDSIIAMNYYKKSPEWLKKLCNAFADGINFYLYTHTEVKPKLIKRFQPWMPFLFSEGSIGGDIETISLKELRELYGQSGNTPSNPGGDGMDEEPRGSNGIAIAPGKSKTGNALFLINPHTSFYFRSEIHVNSEEGMNVYGAVTWGQFFVYQGFNEKCGWMHTSSMADAIDEYAETGGIKKNQFYFNYGDVVKQGTTANISIRYKTSTGYDQKVFPTYYTQHGPVVAKRGDKWITVRLMREPIKALTQSFTRTKAKGFADFEKSMMLRTNSSNNTVYADADGNIGYWHGNFIPRRNPTFDWSKPVDGSNPETEWKGLHALNEIVQIKNPVTGWIQNCNSTPFTASGSASPKATTYPSYMAPDEENPRGIHAIRVLADSTNITLDRLIATAYDSYLPAFDRMLPPLIKAYDAASPDSVQTLAEPMQLLRKWNYRFSATSIETTLAIYWAMKLRQQTAARLTDYDDQLSIIDFLAYKTYDREKLKALAVAIKDLENDFGSWKQPWGELNRYQRLNGNIESVFDDNQPSLAVAFPSAFWGSLASYGARRYPNTKKMYGSSGNSFVAVVEFGKKIKAKSVMVGGESSDPNSPNFIDQAPLYAQGKFKDVLFYYDEVVKNGVKVYWPGQ
jgi:acyl-homoserine lactone acylase PvdQ